MEINYYSEDEIGNENRLVNFNFEFHFCLIGKYITFYFVAESVRRRRKKEPKIGKERKEMIPTHPHKPRTMGKLGVTLDDMARVDSLFFFDIY